MRAANREPLKMLEHRSGRQDIAGCGWYVMKIAVSACGMEGEEKGDTSLNDEQNGRQESR